VNADLTAIANISLALSVIIGLIFGLLPVRGSTRDRRERITIETLGSFRTSRRLRHDMRAAKTTLP